MKQQKAPSTDRSSQLSNGGLPPLAPGNYGTQGSLSHRSLTKGGHKSTASLSARSKEDGGLVHGGQQLSRYNTVGGSRSPLSSNSNGHQPSGPTAMMLVGRSTKSPNTRYNNDSKRVRDSSNSSHHSSVKAALHKFQQEDNTIMQRLSDLQELNPTPPKNELE